MRLKSPIKLLCLALTILVLTGCTTLTSPARRDSLSETNKVYWFDYAAERRGGFLIPKIENHHSKTAYSICAEPAPDVALKHTTDLATIVKIPNMGEGQLTAKIASDAIELAGRTQIVLFLREAMYRLCEQGINGNLSSGEAAKLYADVINASVDLAKAIKAQEIRKALESAKDPETQKTILDKFNK